MQPEQIQKQNFDKLHKLLEMIWKIIQSYKSSKG